MLTPWKEIYDQHRQHIENQRHYFANKGPSSKGYGFSSAHVWMWQLDCEESWALKNWCFWTVMLEKTLENPLDCKEIRSNQSTLKEINPEYSLKALMLKLKLQYFGHWCKELAHWKTSWCWERFKAGEGDDRGWDGWMASPTLGACSNLRPLTQWCHPTISSSVIPFSCLESFPASGSF